MTTITIVHGAPGCGKTHTLLDAVEQHHEEDGVGLFDVYLANFTNNGREATADDLVEREIFDLSDLEDGEEALRSRCRTLHSIALRTCPEVEEPQEQVITIDENPEVYEGFCREAGLDFEPEETNPLELIQGGKQDTPRGNRLFAIDQWLHARYLPSIDRLEKLTECPVQIELSYSRVRELLRSWAAYKRRGYRRFEHHDYVDLCLQNGYTPDVRLLCVDEFQDLSPSEYALYKTWRDSGAIEWIYVAGDTNQSIYSFRSATPLYLAKTPVDERRYLTESYRCPTSVSAVARGILEAEPSITRNVFNTAERAHGHTPEGEAGMRTIKEAEALADAVREALAGHEADGDREAVIYLLTRTNWQLGVLASTLQRAGVPFDALGEKMNPWPDHVVDCLLVLRALRRGTPATVEAVETLLAVATNSERRTERFEAAELDQPEFRADDKSGAVAFPEQIEAAFPGRTPRTIVDVLELTDYQKDMLRGALASEAAPYPERVQVGTIHEAKGLQAPCVFLFTETTSRILDRYQSGEGRAEEHRVYYVGATRASESLHVVDGFFEGPRSPIFDDGLPGHAPADADGESAQEAADT